MDTPRPCRKSSQVIFSDGISKWEKPSAVATTLALTEPTLPKNIVSIAAGNSHSAIVKADGTLWTWGNNEYGQLALGTTENHNVPQYVGSEYEQVNIDIQQTLALKKGGGLWRWGALSTYYPRGDFQKQKQTALAAAQVFPRTTRLLQSGYQLGRGLGLRADGTILDWPSYGDTSKKPTEFGRDVLEISARQFESFALKKDGTLWQLAQYPINPPPNQIGVNFVHVVTSACGSGA